MTNIELNVEVDDLDSNFGTIDNHLNNIMHSQLTPGTLFYIFTHSIFLLVLDVLKGS